MIPNIIIIAVNKMTCMINDLFTNSIWFSGAIDKNNNMVIKPRGATKSSGNKGSFDNLSCKKRTKSKIETIAKAQKKVFGLRISEVF